MVLIIMDYYGACRGWGRGGGGGIHASLNQHRDMCILSLFFDFSSYPLLNEFLSVILI